MMDQSRYFQKHLKKNLARPDFNLTKDNISKEGMCPSGGGLVTCARLGKGGSQRQTSASLGRVHMTCFSWINAEPSKLGF